MRKIVSHGRAGRILIFLMLSLACFHLLIVTGAILQTTASGKVIESSIEMYRMEIVSIAILVAFAVIVAERIKEENGHSSDLNLRGCCWAIFGFMFLTTVGAIAGSNSTQHTLFGLATAAMAFLSLRISLTEKEES